jgi:hypothetical protein
MAGFHDSLQRPVGGQALARALGVAAAAGRGAGGGDAATDAERIQATAYRLLGAPEDCTCSPSAIEGIGMRLAELVGQLRSGIGIHDAHGAASAASGVEAIGEMVGARHLAALAGELRERIDAAQWASAAALADEIAVVQEVLLGLLFEALSR